MGKPLILRIIRVKTKKNFKKKLNIRKFSNWGQAFLYIFRVVLFHNGWITDFYNITAKNLTPSAPLACNKSNARAPAVTFLFKKKKNNNNLF